MSPKAPRKVSARNAPRIVIVGIGRLGGSLALGLTRAGLPVSVLPRSGDSERRIAKLGLSLAGPEELKNANVCFLAVPDTSVGLTASKLHGRLGPKAAMVHCAGALDLGVFSAEPATFERPRGSFHPLCAVSDPRSELAGHAVAIAASTPKLAALLRRLAKALELEPIEVTEARRAEYHAGAVMAAGLVVALLSSAVQCLVNAGLSEQAALKALVPLTRSALAGAVKQGLKRGLTGPVSRGDLAVVQAHLSALPAEHSAVYRALSLRALQLVADQLPPETRSALERALRT